MNQSKQEIKEEIILYFQQPIKTYLNGEYNGNTIVFKSFAYFYMICDICALTYALLLCLQR
jgi:hypothetical protein